MEADLQPEQQQQQYPFPPYVLSEEEPQERVMKCKKRLFVEAKKEDIEPSPPPKRKRTAFLTRAYIPPARLSMMQEGIADITSAAYQRLAWEAMKKSIVCLINKVTIANISSIIYELFHENVLQGRGLLVHLLIQAQSASPMYTHVYAALVAVVNSKFPQTGELITKRLIICFRESFQENDKSVCAAAVQFLAHLVNQVVVHELVALHLLTFLLNEQSDDSVELAVRFVKVCGKKLTEVTPKGINAVFEMFHSILQSGKITSRVEYMIEVLFAIRKDNFKDYPSVQEELDLVNKDDPVTHLLALNDENLDPEDMLNEFQFDPKYVENEMTYQLIKDEILMEFVEYEVTDEFSISDGSEEDESETDEILFQSQIYLTIISSVDPKECALKLVEEGHEKEIALTLIEICCQRQSCLNFCGMISHHLCLLNPAWVPVFNETFKDHYATCHHLETHQLRSVAKFFGQLLMMDVVSWIVMECIHLNEVETNSSSWIFINVLFQELVDFMGLPMLKEKLRDPILAPAFKGIMPRDNPKNTIFAINYFTLIGLSGLTDDLREHLEASG